MIFSLHYEHWLFLLMSWCSVVCMSVCVCIDHTGEPCKNSWTYWDAVSGQTRMVPRNSMY